MAESLGTLTVGVSANVDPAQQAINKLADTLDEFMRSMQRGDIQPRMFKDLNQHVVDHKKHLAEIAALEEERLRPLQKINAALAEQTRLQAARGLPIIEGRAFAPGELAAEQAKDLPQAQAIRKAYEEELSMRVAAQKRATAEEKRIYDEQQEALQKSSAIKARIRMAEIRHLEQMAIDTRKLNAQIAEDVKQREAEEIKAFQARERRIMSARRFAQIEASEQLAADRRRIQGSTTAQLNFRYIQDSERDAAHARQVAIRTNAQLTIRAIRESEQAFIDARNEMQRKADVAAAATTKRRFAEIQASERAALRGRGMEESMTALSRAFKSGTADGWDANLGRSVGTSIAPLNRVADSTNRTRYAVLNLAYGVQDAATVFGTSGFTGAIRASANNLTGLSVLFDRSKEGVKGLKEALGSAEVAVIGVASALMIGSDALGKYIEKQQAAAEEAAKLQLRRLDPQAQIEGAGRQAELQQQLRDAKEVQNIQDKIKEAKDKIAVAEAQEGEGIVQGRALQRRINQEKQLLKDIDAVAERERQRAQIRGMSFGGSQMPSGMGEQTSAERALLAENPLEVKARIKRLTEELADVEKKTNDTFKERKALLKDIETLQKGLRAVEEREAKAEYDRLVEEEFQNMMADEDRKKRQKEADLEYRVGFLGKRRQEIMAQSRASMANVGVAAFESSTAYESLARSRMQQDPQTDLLQRIVRAEEMATKELAAIREKLDPGRGARIAILEKID